MIRDRAHDLLHHWSVMDTPVAAASNVSVSEWVSECIITGLCADLYDKVQLIKVF